MVLSILAVCALAGCSVISLPTQSHPICSWSSNVPPNGDAICNATFSTIAATLRAAVAGDDAGVRNWVKNPVAVHKILAYGAYLRAQGKPRVHVVAGPTLQLLPEGRVFVVFNIVGSTALGRVSVTEATTLARRHGRWVIVQDERHEAW